MNVRIGALFFGLIAIMARGRINLHVFLVVPLALAVFAINSSVYVMNILFILFFLVASDGVSLKRVVSLVFFVSILGAILHFCIYLGGYGSEVDYSVYERMRDGMGFNNPNMLALVYFSLACAAMMYASFQTRWLARIWSLAFVVLSLYVIIRSDSRTSLYALIFLIVLILFSKWRVFSSLLSRLLPFVFPVGLIVTFFLATPAASFLNEILSMRPYFFSIVSAALGVSGLLIGGVIPAEVPVDNSYLLAFSAVGVPLVMAVVYLCMRKSAYISRNFVPFIVAGVAISLTESYLMRPEIPFSLLFFFIIFNSAKVRLKSGYLSVSVRNSL